VIVETKKLITRYGRIGFAQTAPHRRVIYSQQNVRED